MTNDRRPRRPILALALLGALTLTACGTAAAPAGSPSAPPAAGPSDPPRDLPTTDPSGGGSDGDPGGGAVANPPVEPTPIDPGAGQPYLVIPRPGQRDLHPVAPTQLQASIDGRHVLVKVTWYGGVEPCSILDSVKVERSGSDIAITPFEGSGGGDVMCIEIAVLKATIVDLGELEPGAYRISSPNSDAAPIEITVG
jgi:hypothetical protein